MTGVHSRQDALRQLTSVYEMDHAHAVRTLSVADQMGVTAETTAKGTVSVRPMHNGKQQYEIDDGIPAEAVAGKASVGYTGRETTRGATDRTRGAAPTTKGRQTMPRGTRTAATEAEPNGAVDYTAYANKDATDTMLDFGDWLISEVYGDKYKGDEDSFRDGVRLGGTLRMEFQRSDLNQERRAARKAEREQAAQEAQEAKVAAKADKAKAEASKPAPAKTGTTGRRGSTAPATAAKRGRGRPAKPTAEAPF